MERLRLFSNAYVPDISYAILLFKSLRTSPFSLLARKCSTLRVGIRRDSSNVK